MAPAISVAGRKSKANDMESLTLIAAFTDHYHISDSMPPVITIYAVDRSRRYIRRKIIDYAVMSPYGKNRWAYSWFIKPDIAGSYVVKVYSRDENSNYYRPLEKIINFEENPRIDSQKINNSPEKFWAVSAPTGIAVDSARGFVYVSASDVNKIKKFDLNGVFLTQWGKTGSGNGNFNVPYGISLDKSGNVFVADSDNHRIQKFDPNGRWLMTIGSFGTGDGQFNTPYGSVIDSKNNIYVLDRYNNRIQKFDRDGNFIFKFGAIGSGRGQINNSGGIAIDLNDYIYIADAYNHRVEKFDSNGNYIFDFGFLGSGDGRFNLLSGAAVDASDNIYVCDQFNHRIQKFDPDGTFIAKWGRDGGGGMPGKGAGEFSGPFAIALDGYGCVYVTDYNNHRVQKFADETDYNKSSHEGRPDDNPF